jgi:glutathione S-transferase
MSLVWHLARAADWEAAQTSGAYAISTRGLTLGQVGFIHCSHAHQVAGVVALFYADETAPLTLLGIDPDRLAAAGIELRDEPGDPAHPDGERFPHAYGAIPVGAVVETHPARVVDGRLDAPTWDR